MLLYLRECMSTQCVISHEEQHEGLPTSHVVLDSTAMIIFHKDTLYVYTIDN